LQRCGQQLAELFAVCRGVLLALARRTPHVIVGDSASALWAVARLSPGSDPIRATLLRRVARACVDFPEHHITFAYVRSHTNPADPLTHRHWSLQAIERRFRSLSTIDPIPGCSSYSPLDSPAVIYTPRS
jgi:hypothetical protein